MKEHLKIYFYNTYTLLLFNHKNYMMVKEEQSIYFGKLEAYISFPIFLGTFLR